MKIKCSGLICSSWTQAVLSRAACCFILLSEGFHEFSLQIFSNSRTAILSTIISRSSVVFLEDKHPQKILLFRWSAKHPSEDLHILDLYNATPFQLYWCLADMTFLTQFLTSVASDRGQSCSRAPQSDNSPWSWLMFSIWRWEKVKVASELRVPARGSCFTTLLIWPQHCFDVSFCICVQHKAELIGMNISQQSLFPSWVGELESAVP